jgi:hypothetical protein
MIMTLHILKKRANIIGIFKQEENGKNLIGLIFLTFIFTAFQLGSLHAQIPDGVYTGQENGRQHEIKVNGRYLVYSVYESSPASFIKTLGGTYSLEGGTLHWDLEFNSAFEQDSVRTLSITVKSIGDSLTWGAENPLELSRAETLEQPLDGLWLFATRGPDTGQERRGEENTRKTIKFLIDGRFQWIAYDTADMRFSGTGGGSYTARDGVYTETIEYFSRDNSRVGAHLEFQYEVKGTDWHHTGLNSKGEPLYEIWARRVLK